MTCVSGRWMSEGGVSQTSAGWPAYLPQIRTAEEGSRWSACSAARTYDLDADEPCGTHR